MRADVKEKWGGSACAFRGKYHFVRHLQCLSHFRLTRRDSCLSTLMGGGFFDATPTILARGI